MGSTNDKQNLRKQVLYYHYELSGGYTLKPILRSEIAKKIGLSEKEYNNQELISAIQYLNDKGFLEVKSNVQDSITDYGVDEVEEGFPTLPGILVASNKISPIIESMQELLTKMNNTVVKCEQGLLEAIPFHELFYKVEVDMAEIVQNLDEMWQLRCKKMTRQFRNEPKRGFCNNLKEASEKFTPWIDFINEIIETLTGEKPQITESYLGTGNPYTARKMLRNILRNAKQEIVIMDNFLHHDTISVVESCVLDNSNIEIKFLTKDIPSNRNFAGFRSDYLLFKQEHSNVNIEAKTNDQCHGRFLIIDRKDVYHSGHSFHDLGKKADHVNKMEDETSKQDLLKDFNNWWNTGLEINEEI